MTSTTSLVAGQRARTRRNTELTAAAGAAVTTSHVLLGVGLIVVLAVGSQVLASRLRIPPVALLLPVGFIAGMVTSNVNLHRLLGSAFLPLVWLAVAVLLYYSGLSVNLRFLTGQTRRSVFWLVGDRSAGHRGAGRGHRGLRAEHLRRGGGRARRACWSCPGPRSWDRCWTWCGPPSGWAACCPGRATLILPVGAILVVIAFHVVLVSGTGGVADQIGRLAVSVGVGVAGGIVGTVLLWLAAPASWPWSRPWAPAPSWPS